MKAIIAVPVEINACDGCIFEQYDCWGLPELLGCGGVGDCTKSIYKIIELEDNKEK